MESLSARGKASTKRLEAKIKAQQKEAKEAMKKTAPRKYEYEISEAVDRLTTAPLYIGDPNRRASRICHVAGAAPSFFTPPATWRVRPTPSLPIQIPLARH